ncbi:DNA polymerase III subunit beta [candidate division WWE3 bacterium]|uniref:Beta sliding clamp n=1 Tax=candidate division WWE3 bacterium TaxID=2053526 RepID=A0A955LFW7_UNCKA|nr:DNA polymerase III subunit beta [candidate division WWE3 bacterium]
MKAEVLQEKLATAFALTNRVSSSKTTLPILSNTLISTDNGRLKIASTNLEVSLELWVGGKVDDEGSLTVATGLFQNYIQSLSPEKLTLSESDNQLHVTGATTKASFVTMPSEDFPGFPLISEESLLRLSPFKLQSLLKKILYAAATNEARPVLTGVLCRGTSDGLIMAATDGFRLAEVTVGWEILNALPPAESFELIIPAKMLKEVGQFSAGSEGDELWEMKLTQDKNQVVFTTSDLHIYARLLEADFPQYQNIIPTDITTTVDFDHDAMVQGIKTAAIFAHSQSNTIKMAINQQAQTVTLEAESNELGRQETTLPVSIEGESLETAFNANYLLDALSGLDSDQVRLQMHAADSPALLVPATSQDNEQIRQVIMPIRLDRSS